MLPGSPSRSKKTTEGSYPHPARETPRSSFPLAANILLALAALGLLGYALRLWFTPIWCSDLWFHLKAGEWIFTHHRVPRGDLFSAGYQGREWIVNAWLAEVLLWGAYRLGGPAGVLSLQILLALGVFTIIVYFSSRVNGRPSLSLLVALLAMMASYYRYSPRPEIFTAVLLAATGVILTRYKLGLSDRVFWLVPIGALWANLHMGFTSGIAVAGCFVSGDALVAWYYSTKGRAVPDGVVCGPRLRRLALATAGMALATLANPYGLKAWFFMQKLSGQFGRIGEWLPLMELAKQLDLLPVIFLAALAALTLGALLLSRRPQDLVGWLLVALFGAMALKFSRQSAQFCLMAAFAVAMATRGLRFPAFAARVAGRISERARVMVGAAGVLALVVAAHIALIAPGIPREVAAAPFAAGVDRSSCSEGAMRFIRENGLLGRKVFNSLELGGWMIWNLWPQQRVFIDGRLDMYGLDVDTQYLKVASDPNIGRLLTNMGIDYCYFRYMEAAEAAPEYPTINLRRDPNWAMVYFDDAGVIFVRREPRYREMIAQHEYRFLNPLTDADLQFGNPAVCADQITAEVIRSRDEAPDSAMAGLAAGVALQSIGQPQASIERLEEARSHGTRWRREMDGRIEDYLGRASMGTGDLDAAIQHFGNALRAATATGEGPIREAGLRNNLGYALYKQRKLPEAEAEFRAALRLNDGIDIARINLARILLFRNDYREASGLLKTVLMRSPNVANARIFLAKCDAMTGNPEAALRELQVAAKLDPGMTAQALQDPGFDSLRADSRFQALVQP